MKPIASMRCVLAVCAVLGLAVAHAAGAAETDSIRTTGETRQLQVNIVRVPVKAGVSFDDAVDSLKLRANARNFKFVGHSPLSKEVEAALPRRHRGGRE
jgi:hypothetical protein